MLWGADLTRRMLEEGLVPTNVEAARTVMYAASNPEHEPWRGGPHVLVDDAVAVYTQLKPAQTEPWVPQPTTGYATNHDGDDVFVGEHGDLLWRVLTETDHTGWSPLKARLYKTVPPAQQQTEMVAAAALNIENSLTCQHRRYPS